VIKCKHTSLDKGDFMKVHKLSCPNCNGILELNVDDKEYIFCPYCGQKFFVEDGKKEYTINQNINIKKDININKNVTHTNRTYDEAEIIKAKTDAKEKKNSWWLLVGLVIFFIADMAFLWCLDGADERAAQKAKEVGKISAGSDEDYIGENYEAVVEQLETLGFTNIKTVDLDDSGIAFWNADKVESVSISGDTTFYSSDYFEPDVAIIVKYH